MIRLEKGVNASVRAGKTRAGGVLQVCVGVLERAVRKTALKWEPGFLLQYQRRTEQSRADWIDYSSSVWHTQWPDTPLCQNHTHFRAEREREMKMVLEDQNLNPKGKAGRDRGARRVQVSWHLFKACYN